MPFSLSLKDTKSILDVLPSDTMIFGVFDNIPRQYFLGNRDDVLHVMTSRYQDEETPSWKKGKTVYSLFEMRFSFADDRMSTVQNEFCVILFFENEYVEDNGLPAAWSLPISRCYSRFNNKHDVVQEGSFSQFANVVPPNSGRSATTFYRGSRLAFDKRHTLKKKLPSFINELDTFTYCRLDSLLESEEASNKLEVLFEEVAGNAKEMANDLLGKNSWIYSEIEHLSTHDVIVFLAGVFSILPNRKFH